MNLTKAGPIVEIAKIDLPKEGTKILLLRKLNEHTFKWFIDLENEEKPTEIEHALIPKAIQKAYHIFRINSFRLVNSGFRYSLPERDEHGINATFHEMIRSYSSSNGIYFDQELGHNFYVQNASIESRDLFAHYKKMGKLESLT